MSKYIPDPPYGYENDYEEDILNSRKKGGFIGKVVAVLIGIILGIVVGLGALVGAGFVIVSKPINETVAMVDPDKKPGGLYEILFGNEETAGFLNTTYESELLLTLITDITAAAGEVASNNASLNTVNAIIPKTTELVDKLVQSIAEIGIPVKTAELMDTKISDLTGYLTDTAMETEVASLIDVDPEGDNSFLMYMLYGEEGIEYTIENGEVVMNEGYHARTVKDLKDNPELFSDIRLYNIISADYDNTLVMYVLYGKEGIHYKIETKGEGENAEEKVELLQKYVIIEEGKLYNEYGEEMTDCELTGTTSYTTKGENPTTFNLKIATDKTVDVTIGGVKKTDIVPYFVFDENDEVVKFEATKLTDLGASDNSNPLNSITKRITVGEIMDKDTDLSSNIVLKHFSDTTIDNLPTAIEALTINELFADNIYKKDTDGNFELDGSGNKILTSLWKYMLVKDGVEQNYTIKQMGDLTDNMLTNIRAANLKDLSDDEIFKLEESTLKQKIINEISIGGTKIPITLPESVEAKFDEVPDGEYLTVGDLNAIELASYLGVMLSALNGGNS